MAETPATRHRGSGRAAFIARLSTIRAEIAAGDFLVTVHNRHKGDLGITYSAFRKLVQRYADDAKPLRSARSPAPVSAKSRPALPPAPPVETKPQPVLQSTPGESLAHARHEHRPRTFTFDGNPKQDDKTRLIGGPSHDPKD